MTATPTLDKDLAMPATAQGRPLPCDAPTCTKPATVDRGAFGFCAEHAGRPQPAPLAASATPPRPTVDLAAVTGEESQHGVRLAGANPIGMLLEDASGHTVAKVRRLGGRIETLLDELRVLVREHAEHEAERKAAAEVKEKARAEVARLEEQLRAAKAKLTGKPATTASTGSTERLCDSCGKPSKQPGVRGPWPKTCRACKDAAAA